MLGLVEIKDAISTGTMDVFTLFHLRLIAPERARAWAWARASPSSTASK